MQSIEHLRTPTGQQLVGLLETIPAVAPIEGFDASGYPVYCGGSNLDWDSQVPVKRDGELVFVDESGDKWKQSELVTVEPEGENNKPINGASGIYDLIVMAIEICEEDTLEIDGFDLHHSDGDAVSATIQTTSGKSYTLTLTEKPE